METGRVDELIQTWGHGVLGSTDVFVRVEFAISTSQGNKVEKEGRGGSVSTVRFREGNKKSLLDLSDDDG